MALEATTFVLAACRLREMYLGELPWTYREEEELLEVLLGVGGLLGFPRLGDLRALLPGGDARPRYYEPRDLALLQQAESWGRLLAGVC